MASASQAASEALRIRAEGIRINFVPDVFGDPMYSTSLLKLDGYSRSGCESLASHMNYMCLSLFLSLLVIVLLLTVLSAETSAAEQE